MNFMNKNSLIHAAHMFYNAYLFLSGKENKNYSTSTFLYGIYMYKDIIFSISMLQIETFLIVKFFALIDKDLFLFKI